MGGKATYLMINPSPSSLAWRSCFTHSSCPLWSVPNKTEKFNKIFETSTESVSPSHGPFEAADLYVLKSLLTVLDSKWLTDFGIQTSTPDIAGCVFAPPILSYIGRDNL